MSAGETSLGGDVAQRTDRVVQLMQPIGQGGLGSDRVGLVRESVDRFGEARDVSERGHGVEPLAQIGEAALDFRDHGMILQRRAVRLDAHAERTDLLLE